MPSNKPKVLSYLDDDEYEAFKEFKESNNLGGSEAVNLLIRNYLIESDGEVEQVDAIQMHDARLNDLEKYTVATSEERVNVWSRLAGIERRLAVFNGYQENLKEQQEKQKDANFEVSKQLELLEYQIDELEKREERRYSHWLDDEQIAAVTGQSVWKVRLWRCGLQKPRGKRIKAKLASYEVVDGRWKKKEG